MTKSQPGSGQMQGPAGRNQLGTVQEEKQKPLWLEQLNGGGGRWGGWWAMRIRKRGRAVRGQREKSQERTQHRCREGFIEEVT